MQPPEQQQQPPQQPPVIRRKYARRRLRDRKGIRRAQISARGLLTGGAALILLGGSQAGLASLGGLSGAHHADSSASAGGSIDGGSPGLGPITPPGSTSLGPTQSPTPGSSPSGPGGSVVEGGASIPAIVMAAYLNAQQRLAASQPGCHLPWQLLAAIGEVESGQAEGGNVSADGTARSPILGPVLNGNGFAAVHDGSGWARAEGPMQFIPSTWSTWGVDGNGDGKADPENVYDAALSAGDYLCAGSRDLSRQTDMNRAILGYNYSSAYLSSVLSWYRYYKDHGAIPNGGVAGAGGTGGAKGAKTKSNPYLAGAGPTATASPTPSTPTAPGTKGSTGGSAGSGVTPGGAITTRPGGGSGSGSGTGSGGTSGAGGGGTPSSPSPTPSTSPTSSSPSPSPSCTSTSPSPSPSPTGSPSPSPTSGATAGASASASTSTSATAGASADPSASPSDSTSPTPSPTPTCA
ncbi:lytic transglycosylase domain-containing protein [Phaeacidiphilus oryzae]|uniref:lytic transglycosylase domain-containing protein n=1 Tax=Phaeacidiphilus oryzae TaxID=348818 RepID=UPI00068C2479|nr:lytic transglycosylase domain-containing protein [Phaeacidiphilus oryzae]